MITEADATLRLHGAPGPTVEPAVEPAVDLLARLTALGVHVLASRAVAGSPCHLVVAPSGVWVIDERRVQEPPAGGLLGRRTAVIRLGPAEVAGVAAQHDAIRAAVPGMPVQALVCVTDRDWPLLGGAYPVGEVQVLWPERACQLIVAEPVLGSDALQTLSDELDAAFPT